MYEVYLKKAAENDLKRLPTTAFRRVIPHIKGLAQSPRPSGCRKLTGSKNDWQIRIRDYRVLYEIDERTKAVRIMRVRHRRQAYRG